MKRSGMPGRKTPLRSGKPLKRTEMKRSKTRLGSTGDSTGSTGLKRSAWTRTPKAEDPALRRAKVVVRARSGGHCEVRSPRCVGRAHAAHHVLRRPHMTRDHWHDPALMLDSCDPCHTYLHANITEAFERGWLVHAPPSASPRVAVD